MPARGSVGRYELRLLYLALRSAIIRPLLRMKDTSTTFRRCLRTALPPSIVFSISKRFANHVRLRITSRDEPAMH